MLLFDVCVYVHLVQYLIFICAFLNDWKWIFNKLWNLEHTRHTHTCFTFILAIAHQYLGEKTKNGVMDVSFFSCYLHLSLSRQSTHKTTYVKYAAIFHKLLLKNYFHVVFAVAWYSCCWCEHSFTLNHWRVFICCLVCWLIFVCPLRAIHRNYNEQINRRFPSFVCCRSLKWMHEKMKLSLFFFERF